MSHRIGSLVLLIDVDETRQGCGGSGADKWWVNEEVQVQGISVQVMAD